MILLQDVMFLSKHLENIRHYKVLAPILVTVKYSKNLSKNLSKDA